MAASRLLSFLIGVTVALSLLANPLGSFCSSATTEHVDSNDKQRFKTLLDKLENRLEKDQVFDKVPLDEAMNWFVEALDVSFGLDRGFSEQDTTKLKSKKVSVTGRKGMATHHFLQRTFSQAGIGFRLDDSGEIIWIVQKKE